jgi:hypothetical protein
MWASVLKATHNVPKAIPTQLALYLFDDHPSPICLPKRTIKKQTCVQMSTGSTEHQETCSEVLVGCGDYEVSGKKPKN